MDLEGAGPIEPPSNSSMSDVESSVPHPINNSDEDLLLCTIYERYNYSIIDTQLHNESDCRCNSSNIMVPEIFEGEDNIVY